MTTKSAASRQKLARIVNEVGAMKRPKNDPERAKPERRVRRRSPRHELRQYQAMQRAIEVGDGNLLLKLISEGGDVNARGSITKASLLHLAAANSAHQCLAVLARTRQCNYLVRDANGYLPSEIAFIHSSDSRAGVFLARMEARQLVAKK